MPEPYPRRSLPNGSPLIGRPGMVARVDHWPRLDDGRLVVLEHRAGRIATLIETSDAAEAWMCRLMGPAVRPGDADSRELYLPDGCLTPVGAMNSDQVAELRRAHAREEFDAVLADLGKILSRGGSEQADFGESLGHQLDLGVEQALIEHALQPVATGTALHDVGFRHVSADQDLMRWVLGRPADRLRFEAIQEPFGRWQLSCHGRTPRSVICSEESAPAEGCRGELLAPVLRIWRDAYPGEAVPQGLKPAELYLRHRRLVGPDAGADAARGLHKPEPPDRS